MKSRLRILVSSFVLLASCVAGEGIPSSARQTPAIADPIVRVDGSCAAAHPIDAEGLARGSARPVGDLGVYRTPLYITEERIRVRANATWPGADHRNVIGSLRGHRWVLGQGPLEDAEISAGIGYAVAVEDSSGARCRGYVSMTVVRPRE